jgi:transposase-like protein
VEWIFQLFLEAVMTRKRFSEEDILEILRQIELDLSGGSAVEMAIRTAGISDATYYKWRKRYGGMGKSKLREFKSLAVTSLISASGAGSENSTAPLL